MRKPNRLFCRDRVHNLLTLHSQHLVLFRYKPPMHTNISPCFLYQGQITGKLSEQYKSETLGVETEDLTENCVLPECQNFEPPLTEFIQFSHFFHISLDICPPIFPQVLSTIKTHKPHNLIHHLYLFSRVITTKLILYDEVQTNSIKNTD